MYQSEPEEAKVNESYAVVYDVASETQNFSTLLPPKAIEGI
jgi:hypothetical protein